MVDAQICLSLAAKDAGVGRTRGQGQVRIGRTADADQLPDRGGESDRSAPAVDLESRRKRFLLDRIVE